MHYDRIMKGTFLSRPNRFIAYVELEGETIISHVKNTGRCRELLLPGAVVYLQATDNPRRKTAFDLIAVEKGGRLINMDSQAPNQVFAEWARAGNYRQNLTLLRPETTYGSSRFDFYWEAGDRRGYIEVKGVTLEEDGAVLFPDAPTERGIKHVEELIVCRKAGFEAGLCFVVQMSDVTYFTPNDRTHPAFGNALRTAADAGVELLAYDCVVTPESLTLHGPVEVRLDQ